MADIIVHAIAGLFFQNDRKGLARRAETQHMFNPIRAETVVLVATLIQHALEEYATSGTRVVNRVYGPTIMGM